MKYTFSDLLDIMKRLRGEGGCPWDAEQTHDSIKRCAIEEAYEVLEAIESGNGEKMADELGDLLLQIVFHAEIGSETGEFDINDVTTAICEKMIRRHPHVFGDTTVSGSDEVLTNWDEIKKGEKGDKTTTDTLSSVSAYLPALMRAQKVQGKASKVGFDWEDIQGAIDKIKEETAELEEAVRTGSGTEEELGDLLFSVVNASRFIDVNSEEALSRATEKFIKRFGFVESEAAKEGKSLDNMNIKEMDLLWERAKMQKNVEK